MNTVSKILRSPWMALLATSVMGMNWYAYVTVPGTGLTWVVITTLATVPLVIMNLRGEK